MANVSDEGKMLLARAAEQMGELRGVREFIAKQMEEALRVEARKHSDALAQTVAALLDAGVPKAQIAKACGYKNYYVSLKNIDEQAQKYRWVDRLETATIASVQGEVGGRAITWVIEEQGEWSEPNQWGEREIALELLVGDVRATVYVTEIENVRTITYVDLPENPSVTVSDVNALKNEIMEALNG